MNNVFFIAGTDTGIGKTYTACLLLRALAIAGYSTIAIKPIATGAVSSDQDYRNQDALLLQAAATFHLDYSEVNPLLFKEPIAPHIAARNESKLINIKQLARKCWTVIDRYRSDWSIIEGIGGWRVPLNQRETLVHFVKELGTPVILVVGIRLGCLNHTLLTVDAMKHDGANVIGWIANIVDGSMRSSTENIAFLIEAIPYPHLGTLPFRVENDNLLSGIEITRKLNGILV